MANLTTSSDIDTFMGSANNAAARTNLGVLPLAGGTLTGQLIQSTAGAASTPPMTLTGAFFTGGSATTTKPQFLIEPTGTTSTGWSTSGTGLGVNAASGFAGNLVDFQLNGSSKFAVSSDPNTGWSAGGSTMIVPNFGGAGRMRLGGTGGIFLYPSNELTLGGTTIFGWVSGSNDAGSAVQDLTLGRAGAAMLQMGVNAAGVTNQHFKACNRITSNGVGANLTLSGGNGRGGAGGDLIFASYTTAGSGLAGTLTTRWQLDAASGDLLPGTTAAYNIGSSALNALGVYSVAYYVGATQVVGNQQAAVPDATGGVVVDDEARDAINGLLSAVRAHGLIAT